jgi:hypothetical protein
MNYSPKLKVAMEEIKGILAKHDIGGSIVLHTPGFGEHFIKIDPSYSGMKFEHHGPEQAVRIKIKASEMGKDHANKVATDTCNMSHILTTLVGNHAMMLIEMDETLEKHFDSDHKGGGHSSNQSQMN